MIELAATITPASVLTRREHLIGHPFSCSYILSVSLCRKAGHGKLMFYGGPVLRTIGVVGFGVMNLLRSGGVAEGHLQHGNADLESYRYL
jgi:hypothetical protein